MHADQAGPHGAGDEQLHLLRRLHGADPHAGPLLGARLLQHSGQGVGIDVLGRRRVEPYGAVRGERDVTPVVVGDASAQRNEGVQRGVLALDPAVFRQATVIVQVAEEAFLRILDEVLG